MPLYMPESVLRDPVLSLFSLSGKVCLVTGAAQGIGHQVVTAFAEAGADVAFTYLSHTDADATAKVLADTTGRRVKAYQGDVAKRDEIHSVVDQVVQDFGRLDVVVANSGVCDQIPALDVTEAPWQWNNSVNYDGVMWTAQAAGKIFKKTGQGNLIVTASVSSVISNTPQPQVTYNSSKAAAAHLAKCLAAEWVDFARVNAVSPGYVGTHIQVTQSQPEDIQKLWISQVPAHRTADPAELKGLYTFLASDASSYVTGANIIIDGAYSVW